MNRDVNYIAEKLIKITQAQSVKTSVSGNRLTLEHKGKKISISLFPTTTVSDRSIINR